MIPAGSDKNIGSNTDQWNDIYINGTAYIDTLRVEDTTDNTLGDVNTGSAQFDGGVGIAKKLTVGMAVTSKDLIYADEGFRLAQNKDLAMGSEHKFRIFENTDGDGVVKHQGDTGNLEITVKGGNTIKFGSNNTSNCAEFTAGAGCQLKFNTATKLETVTDGVAVTGTLTVSDTLTANDITVDNVQINGNTVQATSGDLVLTAPGGVIDINDAVDISDNLVVRASGDSNSASTGALQVINGGAGINKNLFVGQDVRCAGDIIAFYSSDERLKDNITPIADAVNKVKSISGNTFEWNENSNHDGEDTGVIAQEIEALGLPGVTKKKDNGYLGVRYEKLVPLLIEAIKELSDKVDDLEQKLSDK